MPTGSGDQDYDTIDHMAFASDTVGCALLPAGHPLAQQDVVTKEELAALPLMIVSPHTSPDFYARAMQVIAATGVRVGAVLAFDGVQTAWAHIARGKGWSFGINRFIEHPPAGC